MNNSKPTLYPMLTPFWQTLQLLLSNDNVVRGSYSYQKPASIVLILKTVVYDFT